LTHSASYDQRHSSVRHALGLLPLFAMLLLCITGFAEEKQSTSAYEHERDEVWRVAKDSATTWLADLNRSFARDYGFESENDITQSATFPPVPLFGEAASGGLKRADVEEKIHQRPSVWLVPIGRGHHLRAAVMIESLPGKKPRALQFGMPDLARRLESGLAVLGWPPPDRWNDLRLFRVMSPPTDILIFNDAKAGWTWVNLRGTDHPTADRLQENQIRDLLSHLSAP
jgi:hypothetical protein